jgi:hypothetical protein
MSTATRGYLMGGHISDTHLHGMAKSAVDDGRPLVLFVFSDFDPAGYWDMPTVIGRKLAALRDLLFPELRFTVVHAALGPDQVRDLDLPSSPLKDGEKRADKWLELYGSEQTEIDALATLQPDVLRRIAREAIAPYYDAGLAARVRAAHIEWQGRANARLREELIRHAEEEGDEGDIESIRERARDAISELETVNADLDEIASAVDEEIGDAPELPEADLEALEAAQSAASASVVIDSKMDFVEATDRLHAHSEMAARRRP